MRSFANGGNKTDKVLGVTSNIACQHYGILELLHRWILPEGSNRRVMNRSPGLPDDEKNGEIEDDDLDLD